MPKELLHWHIAREALLRGVPAVVEEILANNSALYYIGAVAHDTAFYDLSRPSEASIERVANQLHGVEGENTLLPLVEMMEAALAQKNQQIFLAFLLGMLTHFVVDSTFHPMVYYLSGNYFAEDPQDRSKAVFRHRLLETAIDLWLETTDSKEYPQNLIYLWREAGDSGRQVFKLFVEHYAHKDDKSFAAHFNKAWRNHRLFQTAFSWSFPWRVLVLYRRFGRLSLEKLEALFYPQKLNLSFLETDLDWLHPVSGEPYKMSLADLCDLCTEKIAALFTQLGNRSLEKWSLFLREQPPLSLDSGLSYVPVKKMKFFWAEPIEYRLRV